MKESKDISHQKLDIGSKIGIVGMLSVMLATGIFFILASFNFSFTILSIIVFLAFFMASFFSFLCSILFYLNHRDESRKFAVITLVLGILSGTVNATATAFIAFFIISM